ncbi:MAG TPA: hypothetical protein VF514_05720 [Bacteroidota bacterium]
MRSVQDVPHGDNRIRECGNWWRCRRYAMTGFVRDDWGKIGVGGETVNCLLREGRGEEQGNLKG